MLSTGLLTVNIHEVLTFDGTEIVLHPDLFEIPRRISTLSVSSIKTVPAGGQGGILPMHRSTPSDILPLSSHLGNKQATLNDTRIELCNPNTPGRLEVGQMVEVRVWDALPESKVSPSPPTSGQRQAPTSTPFSIESANNETSKALYTGSSLHMNSPAIPSLPVSLHYSDELQFQSDVEGKNVGNQSTVPLGVHITKDTIPISPLPSSPKGDYQTFGKSIPEQISRNVISGASLELPTSFTPFPTRLRVNSSDGIPRAVPKPPLMNRSRYPYNLPVPDQRRVVSSFPQLQSLASKGHMRDISDMTTETIQGTLPEADVGIEFMTSQDEEDILNKISLTHSLRFSFIMKITELSLTSMPSNARTQVSILRQVAELYNISSYDMVTVNRIEKVDEAMVMEAVSADFVTVTIQDQFIGRGDMYLFQNSLIGRWIYEGQRILDSSLGIRANAREIRHKQRLAKSGIITDESVITFRSRSARIMWLVQLSSEMWDYASPYEKKGSEDIPNCELYFDKFVRFMYKLFKKWKSLKVSHSLTVIFFSRTFIGRNHPGVILDCGQKVNVNVDVYGRIFEDHYKTVVENETNADWDTLICRIKAEFVRFPKEVGWNLQGKEIRQPSNAEQGNVLEAINVCLNLLQFHYLDRDLHRTGNSIVLVSSSNGVFEVDKGLAGITLQRMMDNGIGSDMLSLGLPPLHIAPFFLYNNASVSVDKKGRSSEHQYYEVPHWMHLSFVSYDSDDLHLPLEEHAPIALNDIRSPKPEKETAKTMMVAANGFVLPAFSDRQEAPAVLTTLDLPHAASKSFTALANIAASPKVSKSKSQQRALIEGRDFQDILEACRPRKIHSLPSPLISQLSMKAMQTSLHHPQRNSTEVSTQSYPNIEQRLRRVDGHHAPETLRLNEWGTVDFDDISMATPRLCASHNSVCGPSGTNNSESSGKSPSSVSSSFASHFPNALGKSFDHISPQSANFSNHSKSLPISVEVGIQLQRTPSLIFHLVDEIDTHSPKGDESAFSASRYDTKDSEELKKKESPSTYTSLIFNENSIRLKMRQHDKSLFEGEQQQRPLPSNGSAVVESTGAGIFFCTDERPLRRSSMTTSLAPTSSEYESGGLGVALGQFNAGSEKNEGLRDISSIVLHPTSSRGKPTHFEPKSLGRMDSIQQQSPYVPISSVGFRTSGSGSGLVRRDSLPALATTRPIVKLYRAPDYVRSLTDVQGPPNQHVYNLTQKPAKTKEIVTRRELKTEIQKHHQLSKQNTRRTKSAFNPFRQRDEEEELAKRSHNRRRWSHVFPLGEVEFKRHSGPSWKSLCQPAILPLTVDYLPSVNDANEFDVYLYTLFGTEQSNDTTHKELFLEMVRHRLTQDYQVVSTSAVAENRRRDKVSLLGGGPRSFGGINSRSMWKGALATEQDTVIQHTLSMGHRVHFLSYNPCAGTIDVAIYNKKIVTNANQSKDDKRVSIKPGHGGLSQSVKKSSSIPNNGGVLHDNNDNRKVEYRYNIFSPATCEYTPMTQGFKKFSKPYKWNSVDTLGDGRNKSLKPEMRYRRLTFSLIPPKFDDESAEQLYISKLKRLLDYLGKIRERRGEPTDELLVNIKSGSDERTDPFKELKSARHGTAEEKCMKRIVVDLRKGQHELYEWLEIAIDAEFDTAKTYRLMVNWLVASSSKVETQVQLLLRRSTQYGLKLQSVPQAAISDNLFLNPFRPPPMINFRDESKAKHLDQLLLDNDFVDDGIHMTKPNFLSCVDDDFKFRRNDHNEIMAIAGRQYVHRPTGAIFVRLMRDEQGWAIIAGLINYRVTAEFKAEAMQALDNVTNAALAGISAGTEGIDEVDSIRA